MRELKVSEVKSVAGAAWWSPSNIMDIIHNVTHSSSESKSKPWVDYDGTPSGNTHIGEAIGAGVTVVAGVITLAAIITAASAGIAGIFGVTAAIKKFK